MWVIAQVLSTGISCLLSLHLLSCVFEILLSHLTKPWNYRCTSMRFSVRHKLLYQVSRWMQRNGVDILNRGNPPLQET